MEKMLKWLIKKLVSLYWKRYPFYTWCWGIDEHVDINILSEESYNGRHRYGLCEEVFE